MATDSSIYKNAARKEYTLTDEKRDRYRQISQASRLAKIAAENGLLTTVHPVNTPGLDPNTLMPKLSANGMSAVSLFSGGGGLDLGFDRAGFSHAASYELIPVCKDTLLTNRPEWNVYGGPDSGDVTNIQWANYSKKIDVIHGGPPCQPFSVAGEQKGIDDERNMWKEFNRAVNAIKPRAFVAENVLGLLNPKFEGFIRKYILDQLKDYRIKIFAMHAADFGVPQVRRRVFFVGFRTKTTLSKFTVPTPTHSWEHLRYATKNKTVPMFAEAQHKTCGVRDALGLDDIAFDNLAPTIRSAFTGKRNTTSVLNSAAGQKTWGDMGIWPNGVQLTREQASSFPAKYDHFRLSVQDVAIIQGFPEDWKFSGAVYQILGQIGNSVAPPVACQVAKNVADALTS